jgi:hypothetical protein
MSMTDLVPKTRIDGNLFIAAESTMVRPNFLSDSGR